jgi:ParB family chromosome partitioning protein
MSKPALGRGLGALLGGAPKPASAPTPPAGGAPLGSTATPSYTLAATPTPAPPPGVRKVSIDHIRPCAFQPRKDFSEDSLRELADSIREQGIVQPLVVRPQGDHFELIAGERRWRASKLAGLTEVPIVERIASDREVLELALIENLQRENLNPIEEALGYAQLSDQFTLTQEEIAKKVGRSRAAVANSMRLLKLAPPVREATRSGRLSVGHAKVLLSLTDTGLQESACDRILTEGLSVRSTEELVARWNGTPVPSQQPTTQPQRNLPGRDPHVVDVENRLRERFGTRVGLRYLKGRGSIEIRYFSDDEFERILSILGVQVD